MSEGGCTVRGNHSWERMDEALGGYQMICADGCLVPEWVERPLRSGGLGVCHGPCTVEV